VIKIVALIALLHGPPVRYWLGADKLKHFFMSALIQSATFSAARATGLGKSRSQIAGGVSVVGFGLGKEFHDRRAKKPFSVEDLAWDAAGAVAAAALLNRTR
jgi:putative lipoprotein